jgi:simple sugar transport system substrate-binding protein
VRDAGSTRRPPLSLRERVRESPARLREPMMRSFCLLLLAVSLTFSGLPPPTSAGTMAPHDKPVVFGLLLLESRDDRGWSQTQYEAGRFVERTITGTRMILVENVNPRDRPGLDIPKLVDELVSSGARLVIAGSYDMRKGILNAARRHPHIHFVHVAGDDALSGDAPANLSNLMCRAYFGAMMAGFVAGVTTRSGRIGYVGAKAQPETFRIVSSAYLGARYGWSRIRRQDPKDLHFTLSWIGSWYPIPGKTLDPSAVAQRFVDTEHDVIISGIDSPDALKVAQRNRRHRKEVWAIGNNYRKVCSVAPHACLGTPYLNWVPGYVKFIEAVRHGDCTSRSEWMGPDLNDLNSVTGSSVGFAPGPALTREVKEALRRFFGGLASGEIRLFKGPLQFRDGTFFLRPGYVATDRQLWNMRQLLKGIEGPESQQ